ncbi:uncharacterized protein LOC128245120 [Mya arenaria]|uniref:uncharacterized protein LOC128245120 n=1 Tax=Mya arenaria TaxID=6604 RepID=UPI0022E985AB|nr:uncharacterized protein LOC128245120 [Mya arenaria]
MASQHRKKEIITEADWKSKDYTKQGRKTLIVYFSQLNPIGTLQHAKQKEDVQTVASTLYQDEVDVDIAALEQFFADIYEQRHLEVKLCRNHLASEIEEYLVTLAEDGWKYEAFYFVFLTYLQIGAHGDVQIQVYDKAVPLDFVFNRIKDLPSMALKPKIFLIQADNLRMLYPTQIVKAIPTEIEIKKIPTDADRLVILSTIPQALSPLADAVRETSLVNEPYAPQGVQPAAPRLRTSVLIRAFIKVMNDHVYRDENLLTNSTRILGEVCHLIDPLQRTPDYESYDIPLPLVTSTLTKRYFL